MMKALKILLLIVCISLSACGTAAPALEQHATPASGMPRFEIDAEGVVAALNDGSAARVLTIDYYAGYDVNHPPQECFEPCTRPWKATFASNKAVLIGPGWCAADKATLDSNLRHYKFTITVDGQQVSPKFIQSVENSSRASLEAGATATPQHCRFYGAVAYDWPVGLHTADVQWTWDQDVNDGWYTYRKGTYANEYSVEVTP